MAPLWKGRQPEKTKVWVTVGKESASQAEKLGNLQPISRVTKSRSTRLRLTGKEQTGSLRTKLTRSSCLLRELMRWRGLKLSVDLTEEGERQAYSLVSFGPRSCVLPASTVMIESVTKHHTESRPHSRQCPTAVEHSIIWN